MAVLDTEERDDGVVVARWDDGENRFDLASVREWHGLLDDLEGRDGPLAVVITGAGKFFSNGLDLDRFATEPEEAGPTVDGVHRLLGRMLLLPAWTVMAINGHAFAAGAMLTCTADVRLMREDRGYWCLPEVDLGLPLTAADDRCGHRPSARCRGAGGDAHRPTLRRGSLSRARRRRRGGR